MRILMLSQFYPPVLGGEERLVAGLSVGLAARGHDVAVATLSQYGLPEFETVNGVRVYRVRSTAQRAKFLYADTSHPHAPPVPDPELVLALRRISLQESPEIVHAHNWIVHSFLPLKHMGGAKLLLSLHDFSLACATKKFLYRGTTLCSGPGLTKCLACAADHYGPIKGTATTLMNWTMGIAERRLVDMFLPVSHATAEKNGLPDARVNYRVLPNLIPDDSEAVNPDVDKYVDQLPNEPFLLFVGAFGSYKGLDVLLAAYSQLVNPPPLVLIGYQTSEFPLATQVFPSNVIVLKDWKHDAVMEAWRRCMIGLVPSVWYETFGIVALEAMIMGKPVIASRLGGLPDIVVHGETGLLVAPGSVEELGAAMQALVDDPELRGRLGERAREMARSFKASRVVPQFEAVYRELLG
jgi:glycosyltransferase involved in cell wall biosynthesis